jgi:Tfp pilus assembly protein PilN
MIKINLLAERKPTKAKGSATPGLQIEGLGSGRQYLLVVLLLVGMLAAGGWWWKLSSEVSEWRVKLEESDRELKRLEDVIKKGEQFEKKKELLGRKIDLITNLKKQQAVPVHILDKVSRSLPDFLWLDQMSANDNQITITGKATTYIAVSNLYSNLTRSGYFKDVTLGKVFEVPEGVAFNLTCSFSGESVAAAGDGDSASSRS